MVNSKLLKLLHILDEFLYLCIYALMRQKVNLYQVCARRRMPELISLKGTLYYGLILQYEFRKLK